MDKDTYKAEFETWLLKQNDDFTRRDLFETFPTGEYFYTKTKLLYDQFVEIKSLRAAALRSIC